MCIVFQEDIAERTVKAVEEWTASKQPQLRQQQRRSLLQSKQERERAAEQEQKQREAASAFHSWAERKTGQLVSSHRERRSKAAAEEREKYEAAAEKEKSTLQAFSVW